MGHGPSWWLWHILQIGREFPLDLPFPVLLFWYPFLDLPLPLEWLLGVL
jgi:hypothetical protein